MYTKYPNRLHTDKGSIFTSEKWKQFVRQLDNSSCGNRQSDKATDDFEGNLIDVWHQLTHKVVTAVFIR